jgi:hypothetical protein
MSVKTIHELREGETASYWDWRIFLEDGNHNSSLEKILIIVVLLFMMKPY